MNAAKIRLSQKELELVTSADLILTKNAILEKVKQLLAGLQAKQQECIQLNRDTLPAELIHSSPKISRGENYQGLPYMVLDYPRYFEGENILAVRTMFWWGNFFSITLHLSGSFKKMAAPLVIQSRELLEQQGYYYCHNEDPWQHHFGETNYRPLTGISESELKSLVNKGSFIKLAVKLPLEQWDEAEEILFIRFKEIIKILAD